MSKSHTTVVNVLYKYPKVSSTSIQSIHVPKKRQCSQYISVRQNDISCSEGSNYLCEYCNKNFTKRNNYYRHKKYRCKDKNVVNNSNDSINDLSYDISTSEQSDNENNLKSNISQLKSLKEKLHEKDKENVILKTKLEMKTSENEFNRKLTIGAGQTVNKSLSAIAFVMQNYKNAQPLKEIPHEEFKRLVYQENYGKKLHKNKKVTDFEASEIITYFFKQNNLIDLLGNVIVSFYKETQRELQPLWVSDVSRKSFIVNKECDGINQWATDKSGVKVSEIIVKPLLVYIDKLMVSYMMKVH